MGTEHTDRLPSQAGGEADPIESTPSAYGYPLLVKHLLHTPLAHAPEQEIVYRDLKRYDYRTLRRRMGNAPQSCSRSPADAARIGKGRNQMATVREQTKQRRARSTRSS